MKNGKIDNTAGNTQLYYNYLQKQGGIPNFKPGYGYSPASGPSVGAPLYLEKSFFGYPIVYNSVSKARFGKRRRRRFSKRIKSRRRRYSNRTRRRRYGYDRIPPRGYNPDLFPNLGGFNYELGTGTSPGGIGGIKMGNNQPLAYFNYFGKSKRNRRNRKKRKRSRKRKRKRKSVRKR